MEDFSNYVSGDKLYGDDFGLSELKRWYAEEAEGYYGLVNSRPANYRNNYLYHSLNIRQGFSKLDENRQYSHALGFGSAYGDEFIPILGSIAELTILDPSENFKTDCSINKIPCHYVKPLPSGNMPFEEYQFDLISCLGVLHHIPNVTHVLQECYRCLTEGGVMLLREPIV